ncbi:serine/threonine-protein phosphatase [bacterium]|nr:serine/threonine-protein phosphatase [candidate division CSSED10-310 bacterium]
MDAYGQTDIGCRRAVNQDAYFIDANAGIYIVADGMGGHQAGDLASRLAIRSIIDFLNKQVHFELDDQTIADRLVISQELCRSAVVCANNEVFQVAEEHPELFGMGTTIDMMRLVDGYAVICHVGDSRIYRIADGAIIQLTKDHTQIQELIDQHQITQEEAQYSTMKNVITRALGGAEDVDVDTLIIPVRFGDVFILCTDGLSGVMETWEIKEEFGMYDGDIHEAVKGYIETTLERGAPDNVTVLIAGPADENDCLSPEDEIENAGILIQNLGSAYLGD